MPSRKDRSTKNMNSAITIFWFSVAAGAAWNLASLVCLRRLLRAWLGPQPSQRRAIAWVLVKFPLLYALIVFLFRSPGLSVIGFSLGFSAVLAVALGFFARRALTLGRTQTHVR